jgi:hypothetical protein
MKISQTYGPCSMLKKREFTKVSIAHTAEKLDLCRAEESNVITRTNGIQMGLKAAPLI